ncbi:hypothetical protein [Streptomyces qinglanensis]|uniref:hypothetical protein n=1 Tax=Streptomyces qinglanensis TaxID=943816 RepID=UPI003D71B02A
MKVRSDIAALLREGLSDRRIARQLRASTKVVAATREALGVPKHRPGRSPAVSLEDAFRSRTEPVAGGHLRWCGHHGTGGVPIVCFRGRKVSAYRVAFRIAHGREPQGYCTSECAYPGCVAPQCVEDEVLRTRTRAALAAVVGRQTRGDACRRGHPAAEHRRYTSTGKAYCVACSRMTAGRP